MGRSCKTQVDGGGAGEGLYAGRGLCVHAAASSWESSCGNGAAQHAQPPHMHLAPHPTPTRSPTHAYPPPHPAVPSPRRRAPAPPPHAIGALRDVPQKYRINLLNVTWGAHYYQCVYLLAAKDEATMAAAAAARRVYGMDALGPYMPHLSLLYAELPEEAKARAVEGEVARLYGEGAGYETLLVEQGFPVETIQVWHTDTADRDCRTWCLAAEYELRGGGGGGAR